MIVFRWETCPNCAPGRPPVYDGTDLQGAPKNRKYWQDLSREHVSNSVKSMAKINQHMYKLSQRTGMAYMLVGVGILNSGAAPTLEHDRAAVFAEGDMVIFGPPASLASRRGIRVGVHMHTTSTVLHNADRVFMDGTVAAFHRHFCKAFDKQQQAAAAAAAVAAAAAEQLFVAAAAQGGGVIASSGIFGDVVTAAGGGLNSGVHLPPLSMQLQAILAAQAQGGGATASSGMCGDGGTAGGLGSTVQLPLGGGVAI